MTILVTGATGTVGRHLVQQLVDRGHRVRALTRDPGRAARSGALPGGADVVAGDLTSPASVEPALEGVTGLHLVTMGGDDGGALTTGPELVALATAAGVRRVTVLGGWDEGSVEPALRAGSLGWTFLRPVEFMANTLEWAPMVRDGVVRQLGQHPSALVHEADIAAVAATALTEDGHAGRSYALTGPEALTPAQRVATLASVTGRPLAFEVLTEAQERDRLRSYGYPEDYVEFGVQLALDPPQVGRVVQPTVERVTGRPARPFEQWVHDHAAEFSPLWG